MFQRVMHSCRCILVLIECKRFQKCVSVLSKLFRDFFRIFLEFILIFLELFYLLEGSKIFFHELQILYLDCSCPNEPLGIFLECFVIFGVFLVPLNNFLIFLELFCIKNNFKKKENPSFGLGRARRPDPPLSGLGPPPKRQWAPPPRRQ
jgi:hypothetical protein